MRQNLADRRMTAKLGGFMDETGVALGKYLSSIRETAGLTQAELAKKVTVSPARISRIESGDASLTADEMDQLLVAIGTSAAKELRAYLDQEWVNWIDRPLIIQIEKFFG